MHPRRCAAALAAAASICLSGCILDATLVIRADDTVAVDVTTWRGLTEGTGMRPDTGGDGRACTIVAACVPGLHYEDLSAPADPSLTGCRATGTLPLAELSKNLPLAHVGDRYVLFAPSWWLSSLQGGAWVAPVGTGRDDYLSITFPGPVEAQDQKATVEGNTVVWANLRGVGEDWMTGRIQAVAHEGTHPAVTAAFVVGGVAVGASAGWALVRLSRRRAER